MHEKGFAAQPRPCDLTTGVFQTAKRGPPKGHPKKEMNGSLLVGDYGDCHGGWLGVFLTIDIYILIQESQVIKFYNLVYTPTQL